MPKFTITRIGPDGGSPGTGPYRDICEAIADLYRPHGLDIQISNISGDHWSVGAARPDISGICAGIVIDGA